MSSTTRERTRARARALSALGRNLHRVRDHRLPRQRRGRLRRALPRPVRPGRRRVSAGRAGGQIDCAAPTAVASGLRTVHAAGLARTRTARQPRLGPTPARLWGLSLAHTHHRGPGCTSAAPRLHLCRTSAAPRLNLGCISAAPRPHLGPPIERCTGRGVQAAPSRQQYSRPGGGGRGRHNHRVRGGAPRLLPLQQCGGVRTELAPGAFPHAPAILREEPSEARPDTVVVTVTLGPIAFKAARARRGLSRVPL